MAFIEFCLFIVVLRTFLIFVGSGVWSVVTLVLSSSSSSELLGEAEVATRSKLVIFAFANSFYSSTLQIFPGHQQSVERWWLTAVSVAVASMLLLSFLLQIFVLPLKYSLHLPHRWTFRKLCTPSAFQLSRDDEVIVFLSENYVSQKYATECVWFFYSKSEREEFWNTFCTGRCCNWSSCSTVRTTFFAPKTLLKWK